VKLITMGGFARDAPKAENGFVCVSIVSSPPGRRNIRRKIPIISDGSPGLKMAWQALFAPGNMHAQAQRHARAFCTSHAFYVCLLKRDPNEGWSCRTGGASAATQAIETEKPGTTGRVQLRDLPS
jgi:hypothetical protein